jgi:T4 superinfection immunity protein
MIDALSQRFPGYEDWTIAFLPVFLIAYFTPALIAVLRKHRFTTAIGLINLLLGWTVIGWFASIVWAVNKDVREMSEDPEPAADPLYSVNEPSWNELAAESQAAGQETAKKCLFCAEEIKAEAIVCRYCGRDVAPASAKGQQGAAATAVSIEQGFEELKSLLQDRDEVAAQELAEGKFQAATNYVDSREMVAKEPVAEAGKEVVSAEMEWEASLWKKMGVEKNRR